MMQSINDIFNNGAQSQIGMTLTPNEAALMGLSSADMLNMGISSTANTTGINPLGTTPDVNSWTSPALLPPISALNNLSNSIATNPMLNNITQSVLESAAAAQGKTFKPTQPGQTPPTQSATDKIINFFKSSGVVVFGGILVVVAIVLTGHKVWDKK